MSFGPLKQIWNIVRLRGGPEDLPFSYASLGLFFIVHLLIDLLLSGQGALHKDSLLSAMVNTLFTACFVYILLQWTKKSPRFVQTLSALFGAEILIGLFGVVLLAIYQIPALELLASVLFLFLIVWSGVVSAYIFHRALDTTMLWGAAVALLYIFLAYNIIRAVSAPVTDGL